MDVIKPLSIAVRLDMPSGVSGAGMRKGAGRGAGTGMEAPRGGQGHIITKVSSTPWEMQCDVVLGTQTTWLSSGLGWQKVKFTEDHDRTLTETLIY